MACDIQTLLANSPCEFSCLPDGFQWAALVAAKCQALSMNCDLSTIEAGARCIQQCLPESLLIPALIYLEQQSQGNTQTPSQLASAAACIACAIPPGMQLPALIELECSGGGGGGGGGGVPAAPVALAASDIEPQAFVANWAPMSDATGFRLDVSTDPGFGSFLPGYSNLDVGNVTSQALTGLTVLTTYYYRVRSYNASGTSATSSNIITAITQLPIPSTGLLLYLQADKLVLNNADPVTTWPDFSGNGNDATGAGATRPVYRTAQINSLPAIDFAAASSQVLALPNLFNGSETSAELFIVVRVKTDPPATSAAAGAWTFCRGGADAELMFYPFTNGQVFDNFCTTARKTVGDLTPSLASYRLYNPRSQANLWELGIDGATLFTTGTNTFSTTVTAGRWIGQSIATGQVGFYLNGFIAEVILYDHFLSAPDRDTVKAYIANKYALTIA